MTAEQIARAISIVRADPRFRAGQKAAETHADGAWASRVLFGTLSPQYATLATARAQADAAMAAAADIADLTVQQRKALDVLQQDDAVTSLRTLEAASLHALGTATVVDATAFYNAGRESSWALYEDTVMRPPWTDAAICYTQTNGAVIMCHTTFMDLLAAGPDEAENWVDILRWESLVGNPILWDEARSEDPGDRVPRWVVHVVMYATVGPELTRPSMVWRIAVNEDGVPLDIHWQLLRDDVPDLAEKLSGVVTVVLRALTFLNCRNVTLTVPHRPRAERRRLERFGDIPVHEITVYKNGTTVQGRFGKAGDGGVPVHTVRGHIARYGVEGRGLLFGKIAGRFWIPMHARGNPDEGAVVEQRYTTQPY